MGTFAEGQLQRHGWQKGEGLGKDKKGISKAIQVSKKNDLKGIGHKNDNFEFAWWDHVYNKVSSNVQVDKTGEEVNVKIDNSSDLIFKNQMGIISTDMPASRKAQTDEVSASKRELTPYQLSRKIELYSQFTKVENLDSSSERKFITKISDKDLFEACGKLTARKGARAEQVGKLERTQHSATTKNSQTIDIDSSVSHKPDISESSKTKSKKKKRSKTESPDEGISSEKKKSKKTKQSETVDSKDTASPKKKSKKEKKSEPEESTSIKPKAKKSKKSKKAKE